MIRFQNLKALASIRERDAQQAKQQFDILLREGIRKRFGQYFDDAHRSVLEEELYVIGVRGAESLFLHYLDTLKKIRRFAFPYVCGTENASLVCYCLGITQVDPVTTHSRFEQFLPPDDDSLPALHIELPGNQKEEAWRRFGVGGRFGWIYQRKRAFEVSVQQAERFFMRPSFKDPAVFATLVPDNVPAEQVPKTLAEYVRFCAAERRGRTGKEVLFREDVIELLHAAGYPYAKAERARRHCAPGTPEAIRREREKFCRIACKRGMRHDQALHIFETFLGASRFPVSRACMTAVAQYRYMEIYFKRRAERDLS